MIHVLCRLICFYLIRCTFQPKPEYESMFQNPCWYEELHTPDPYENNTYIPFSPSAKRMLAKLTEHWVDEFDVGRNLSRLRCLPYFLIIGQPKCGTTDLFWKISKHPDVETPPIKELHWWSRSRQGQYATSQRHGRKRTVRDRSNIFNIFAKIRVCVVSSTNIMRTVRILKFVDGSCLKGACLLIFIQKE